MKIDLREIPVYYINMDSNSARKEAIESMLNNYGFKNIIRFSGLSAHHHSVGCALSHQSLLNEIVKKGVETPFLILEDDAKISQDFVNIIEVPDDSDAIYLGLTKCGRMFNDTVSDIIATKINQDYHQIYNMLSAHAIMYTNIEYVKFLVKAINVALNFESHQDIVRSSTMKYFNVYAKSNPLFFQNDEEMNVNFQTNISLNTMQLIDPDKTNLGFNCECHRHS